MTKQKCYVPNGNGYGLNSGKCMVKRYFMVFKRIEAFKEKLPGLHAEIEDWKNIFQSCYFFSLTTSKGSSWHLLKLIWHEKLARFRGNYMSI